MIFAQLSNSYKKKAKGVALIEHFLRSSLGFSIDFFCENLFHSEESCFNNIKY